MPIFMQYQMLTIDNQIAGKYNPFSGFALCKARLKKHNISQELWEINHLARMEDLWRNSKYLLKRKKYLKESPNLSDSVQYGKFVYVSIVY